jgi:hypothetical protein
MRYELQKRAGKKGKEALEAFINTDDYKAAAAFSTGKGKAGDALRERLGERLRSVYNAATDAALGEFLQDPVYGEVISKINNLYIERRRKEMSKLQGDDN